VVSAVIPIVASDACPRDRLFLVPPLKIRKLEFGQPTVDGNVITIPVRYDVEFPPAEACAVVRLDDAHGPQWWAR
jgi:hypothetical protein